MAVPIVYRAVFAIFDIALPLMGVYLHLFQPAVVVAGSTPKPLALSVETQALLDIMSGWYAMLALVSLLLLAYRRNDVSLWKGVQAGVLLTDISQVCAFYRAMSREGRLGAWTPQDYQNWGGYIFIGLVRLAFVMELGVKEKKVKKA